MTVTLFSFVELFREQLATAIHLLDKGAEHVRVGGNDPEAMLGWRLADDMQPLLFQLLRVNGWAGQLPARVAGVPLPPQAGPELDSAGLRTALVDTRAFLAALTNEQFAGRDDEPIAHTLGNGMEVTLPASRWLSGFGTINIHFHTSIAYAILRSRGVPLGKLDLFSAGL